jgi:hypothetical protein
MKVVNLLIVVVIILLFVLIIYKIFKKKDKFKNIIQRISYNNKAKSFNKQQLSHQVKSLVSEKNIESDFSVFLNNFLLYLFEKCNYCPAKELQITGICDNKSSLFYKKYGGYICKANEDKKDCSQKKKDLPYYMVDYVIGNFVNFNLLLYKRGKHNIFQPELGKYYLFDTFKKISWQNIKGINKDDAQNFYNLNPPVFMEIYNLFTSNQIYDREPTITEFQESVVYLKYMFWYFRRAIVDTIISEKLREYNILGISVGSTNITSDYDMTIYGNSPENLSELVIYYRNKVFEIFNDITEVVFDTNLYGMSSWINMIDPELDYNPKTGQYEIFKYEKLFSKEIKICSQKQFKYLLTDDTTNISQHIWSLVKLFSTIELTQSYDDKIYDFLMEKLSNIDVNSRLLINEAFKTVSMYPSNVDNLAYVMKLIERKPVDQITVNYYNNFISYVSYNSPESYFTRGSFLDIVLNQQTCSGSPQTEKLVLNKHEYLDSFIENMSELLTYYRKDKYVKRAKLALNNLYKYNHFNINDSFYNDILSKINNISNMQTICNNKDQTVCTPFYVMNEVIEIITQVMTYCFSQISTNEIINGINNFIIEDEDIIKLHSSRVRSIK